MPYSYFSYPYQIGNIQLGINWMNSFFQLFRLHIAYFDWTFYYKIITCFYGRTPWCKIYCLLKPHTNRAYETNGMASRSCIKKASQKPLLLSPSGFSNHKNCTVFSTVDDLEWCQTHCQTRPTTTLYILPFFVTESYISTLLYFYLPNRQQNVHWTWGACINLFITRQTSEQWIYICSICTQHECTQIDSL